MTCYTELRNDTEEKNKCWLNNSCLKYGWTYGIGWATVALALIGTTISTVGFLMESERIGKK